MENLIADLINFHTLLPSFYCWRGKIGQQAMPELNFKILCLVVVIQLHFNCYERKLSQGIKKSQTFFEVFQIMSQFTLEKFKLKIDFKICIFLPIYLMTTISEQIHRVIYIQIRQLSLIFYYGRVFIKTGNIKFPSMKKSIICSFRNDFNE